MSQPTAPEPAPNGPDEFELLSTPPTAADISGDLKARKGAGPSLVTLSLVGVVLAVGGFAGGIAVGKSSASSTKSTSAAGAANPTRARGQFGGQFGGQNGQAGTRGGTVTGTVQKVDGGTITVVDATGKVTTVDTSDQTTVTVGKPGTVADLSTGAQVTVIGTPGGNGVITARSVLSGVSLGGFGGTRPARTPGATPSSTNG